MSGFELLASPWWVNLLILVPFAAYWWWDKNLHLYWRRLLAALAFGLAFGFVEASVVVYLRAATGLLNANAPLEQVLSAMNKKLFQIEFFREAATMIVLLSVAYLGAKRPKDRVAMFLWVFAAWDLAYYLGLWFMIGWPGSLLNPDVLFLIPTAWTAQVWFPILISTASISVIILSRKK